MKTNLDGFNTKEITLHTEDDIQPGMTVMITEGYEAVIPFMHSRFIGICTARKGNYVTVVVSGLASVKCSSGDIFVGYNSLSADGNGNLELDAAATTETLVVEFDSKTKIAKILL